MVLIGFDWLSIGSSGGGGSCKHGNEPLGSETGRGFLNQLTDY